MHRKPSLHRRRSNRSRAAPSRPTRTKSGIILGRDRRGCARRAARWRRGGNWMPRRLACRRCRISSRGVSSSMLRRILNFVLLTAMIIGVAVTYDMKHKAELAADRNARLEADIAKDKDASALLRAEWSLLTQPSRLQAVVQKYADHFQLQPFSPTQIATID